VVVARPGGQDLSRALGVRDRLAKAAEGPQGSCAVAERAPGELMVEPERTLVQADGLVGIGG
jgi:hypothetical protein